MMTRNQLPPGEISRRCWRGLAAAGLLAVFAAAGCMEAEKQLSTAAKPTVPAPVVTVSGDVKWVVSATARTIEVDGDLSEWDFANPAIVVNAEAINKLHLGWKSPPPQGDDDLSATIQVAWDNEKLYVAAHVTDDQTDETTGENWGTSWEHDTLVVCIAPPIWLTAGPRAVGSPPELFYIGLSYYSPGGTSRPFNNGIRYLATRTDNGYDIEASIPFDTLGFRPAAGDRVPFMVILTDIDHNKPPHLQWDQYGVPTRAFGNPPRQMAQLRLLGPGGWGADILLDKTDIRPGGEFSYLGIIDIVTKPISLRAVEVVSIPDGEVIVTARCHETLEAGKRYQVSGKIELPQTTSTGRYDVRLLAGSDE